MSGSIYFDHASAWPLDPMVVEAMNESLDWAWASPNALHSHAQRPADALERARAEVAALVNAEPEQVILTSGPHESRSLAIRGALAANPQLVAVVTTAAEHPAGLAVCRTATSDPPPAVVGVDSVGRVDPDELAAALPEDPVLVSLTAAQPEIGTLQDLPRLIAVVRGANAKSLIHVDAGDAIGLLQVDFTALDADLLSIGGATLGAPAWTGALLVRPGARLHPLLVGGAQEHGKRSGAVNLPGAIGLGLAASQTRQQRAARIAHVAALDERLTAGLLRMADVRLNGPRHGRLPGIVHVCVGWVEAQTLVLALATDAVACSPGSACTAVTRKAAPILEAIGLEAPWTHSAVLFSLGPTNTIAEVDAALALIAPRVEALRRASPITPR